MEQTRLNKFISESGYCSRREADKYIEQGQVLINGQRAKIGQQVGARDKVMVNGHLIEQKDIESDVYIALNKPPGITSTTDKVDPDNIVDFVAHPQRIFPIGRLDKESQGLIFLTSNGDIVNKILRAGNNHQKEYIVTVDKPITADFIKKMSGGVPILGEVTKKCKVEMISPYVFKIILIQGLNRQIRRMCGHFNYTVTKLERTRIMNIDLAGLPLGEWRELTNSEMTILNNMLKDSSGEAEQSKKGTSGNNQKAKKPAAKTAFAKREEKESKKRSFGSKSSVRTGKPNSPGGRSAKPKGRR